MAERMSCILSTGRIWKLYKTRSFHFDIATAARTRWYRKVGHVDGLNFSASRRDLRYCTFDGKLLNRCFKVDFAPTIGIYIDGNTMARRRTDGSQIMLRRHIEEWRRHYRSLKLTLYWLSNR